MEKYAVFLDFDGTIGYDFTEVKIHPDNIETIKQVRELGHKVFLCTGRSGGFIPEFITDSIEFDGIIAGMGAEIYIDNKTLLCELIPHDQVYKITDYFVKNGHGVRLEGPENVYSTYPSKRYDFVIIKDADEYAQANYPITSILIKVYPDEEIMAQLSEKYELARHDSCFEFSAKGCTKENAMMRILEHFNIPKSHSIAIGDSTNDLGMLKAAGLGIAMGNAYEEVKKEIKTTTDTCENAGVAKALKKHLMK